MMRASVSMFGSPLESGMICRPEARAARTRSVISTVADGLSEATRSASLLAISSFPLRVIWLRLVMTDRRLRQILARWRVRNPATTNRIMPANTARNSTTSHAKAELKAPLDIEGRDFRRQPVLVTRLFWQTLLGEDRPRSHHGDFLQFDKRGDTLLGKREKGQELGLREGLALGRALGFHDRRRSRHDEIGVGLGRGILGIIEVEHRRAVHDAAGYRRAMVGERFAQHLALEKRTRLHPGEAIMQRHPGARDGRRTGSAVGLDHIAIDDDLAFADRAKIGHGAKRA